MTVIKANFEKIRSELKQAQLLAVSKYTSNKKVQELYDLGQRDFGENRVDELLKRSEQFPEDIRWHFIGNLQSKKIKKLLSIKNLLAIHSVDRLSLLDKLLKHDSETGFYLQYKTTFESEKNGFESIEQITEAIQLYLNSKTNLRLLGLMTMAPIRTDHYDIDARKSFVELCEVKNHLEKQFPTLALELNMGMSRDYTIAIDCGSDLVRIGSALFC